MTNAEKKKHNYNVIHLGQKITFWQRIFYIYPKEGGMREAWER